MHECDLSILGELSSDYVGDSYDVSLSQPNPFLHNFYFFSANFAWIKRKLAIKRKETRFSRWCLPKAKPMGQDVEALLVAQ